MVTAFVNEIETNFQMLLWVTRDREAVEFSVAKRPRPKGSYIILRYLCVKASGVRDRILSVIIDTLVIISHVYSRVSQNGHSGKRETLYNGQNPYPQCGPIFGDSTVFLIVTETLISSYWNLPVLTNVLGNRHTVNLVYLGISLGPNSLIVSISTSC